MARRFLVVARPRSRTSWLATFLNAGGAVCQHDIVDICTDGESYREALDVAPISGAVDTGAVLVLPEILKAIPDLILAVIDRPRLECELDIADTCFPMDMAKYDVPMRKAAERPGVTIINYEDLDNPIIIRMLWHVLIGTPFPKLWYEHCRWMHIEPSEKFFNEEFPRRAMNPALSSGWHSKEV
jgi:hypothetical protein